MDESFHLRRPHSLAGSAPARLDYELLIATVAAQAAASAAARAQARALPPPAEPLGEIVLAGSNWREAVSAQRGCFNRIEMKRRRNIR
jgi:hypothetical protein